MTRFPSLSRTLSSSILLLLLALLLLLLSSSTTSTSSPLPACVLQADPEDSNAKTRPPVTFGLSCAGLALTSPPDVAAVLAAIGAANASALPAAAPSLLDLTLNRLTTIPADLQRHLNLSAPQSLRTLILAENGILVIDVNAFANLPNLHILDLAAARVRALPPGLLSHLPRLEQIYLDKVPLLLLESGTFYGASSLEALYIPRLVSNQPLSMLHPSLAAVLDPVAASLVRIIISYQPLLINADWGAVADMLPNLQFVTASASLEDFILPRYFRGLPLRFLNLRFARVFNITHSTFDHFDELSVLRTNDIFCDLQLIERDALAVVPTLRTISLEEGPCSTSGRSSRCASPDGNNIVPAPVTCVCATGYSGDGTFCAPTCPATAAHVGQQYDCSLADRWTDSLCCPTLTPAAGGRPPTPPALTPAACPLAFLCRGGSWILLPALADVCPSAAPQPDAAAQTTLRLDLGGCSLPDPAPPILPLNNASLTTLSLAGSGLQSLRVGAFASPFLTSLDLSTNSLSVLLPSHFSGLAQLEHLNLSNNRYITLLHPNVFSQLTGLKTLLLESVGVTTFFNGAFRGLGALKTLVLDSNALSRIRPLALLGLASIETLSLNVVFVSTAREPFQLEPDTIGLLYRTLRELRLHGRADLIQTWTRDYGFPAALTGPASTLINLLTSPSDDDFFLNSFSSVTSVFINICSLSSISAHTFRNLAKLRKLRIYFCPSLQRIEPDTFGPIFSGSPAELVMFGTPSLCQLSSTNTSGIAVTCSCADGFGGDGSFCEPLCPLSPPLPPGLAAADACGRGATAPSSLSTFWHGHTCLLPNSTANGTAHALVCDGGVWREANLACEAGSGCLCGNSAGGVTVLCQNQSQVPLALPALTTVLNLTGNTLTQLRHGSLDALAALRELDLSGNALAEVDGQAFRTLNSLELLDLSNNRLTRISPRALSHLSKLAELRVSQNRLCALPWGTLALLPRLARLAAADNTALGGADAPLLLHDATFKASFPTLRELDLSNTSLARLPVWFRTALRSLDTLILRHTHMAALTATTVGDLLPAALRSLTLSVDPVAGTSHLRIAEDLTRFDPAAIAGRTEALVVHPAALDRLTQLAVLDLTATPHVACRLEGHGSGRAPVVCDCASGFVRVEGNATASSLRDLHVRMLSQLGSQGCVSSCPATAVPFANSSCPAGLSRDLCQVACPEDGGVAETAILRCNGGAWEPFSVGCPGAFGGTLAELEATAAGKLPIPTAAPSAAPTGIPTPGPQAVGAPTAGPTAAPASAGGGGSGTGSSSGGSSGGGAGLLVGVVLAVVLVAVLAVGVWLWRRSQAKQRAGASILGELRELVLVNNTQAREMYENGGFGRTVGPEAACEARLHALELVRVGELDLKAEAELGQGQGGRVVQGVLRTADDGATPVAVKLLHEGVVNGPACTRLLLEARVMAMLQHPNLVALLAAQTQRAPVMLVMELCSGGDLLHWLRSRRPDAGGQSVAAAVQAAHPQLTAFARDVAAAMAYLHARLLLHRDLAARNVLLAAGGACESEPQLRAKLADFGLSRALQGGGGDQEAEEQYYRKRSDDSVPVKWMCPVAVTLKRITKKSDVWSFGVVLWEMWTLGQAPWANMLATEAVIALQQGRRLERPGGCDDATFALMSACWDKVEAARPSFSDIVATLGGNGSAVPSRALQIGRGDGGGVGGEGVRQAWGGHAGGNNSDSEDETMI